MYFAPASPPLHNTLRFHYGSNAKSFERGRCKEETKNKNWYIGKVDTAVTGGAIYMLKADRNMWKPQHKKVEGIDAEQIK